MMVILFLFSVLFLVSACDCNSHVVESPSGRWRVEFFFSSTGIPHYRVVDDITERNIVADSRLGHVFSESGISEFDILEGVEHESFSTEWNQPWGENTTIIDAHNRMSVRLRDSLGNGLQIHFKAFDDGVAFRYDYSIHYDTLNVLNELTEFNFLSDGSAWYTPGNFESYELEYLSDSLSNVRSASTPFTFRLEEVYCSIHEAALYNFPEMVLLQKDSLSFVSLLAPYSEATRACVPGTFSTPWRTIQLSNSAVGLINSSMILNLNEPSKIGDCGWIKPHKYIGVWWEMHLGTKEWRDGPRKGATTLEALRYIDFASENNIDGVLFEGWNRGWENWGGSQEFDYAAPAEDFDLELIAEYAKTKGVNLWAHNETGGNIYDYESKMEEAFELYNRLGIHYLKTGYAGGMPDRIFHHSQQGVQHYQKVVELAARYKIALDVHEPIKETGIRRTWPNMMTREGAKGMEWNAWSKGNSSEHLTVLPFTRLLAGPMDYTPGVFDIYFERARGDKNRQQWNGDNSECFIKTTLARQMANWVILYSPLQMACDMIKSYQGHPAFEFFREFNPDCDWSEALQGEVGEYIVIARRSGGSYFVGAGTNSQERTLSLPLDFLDEGVEYLAKIYGDDMNAPIIKQPDGTYAPDKRCYTISQKVVTSADVLEVAMAPDGGQAISFVPIDR